MDEPNRFSLLLDRWVAAEEGRSDAAFARVLSIDPSTICRARRGAVRLDTRHLAAACVALGATADESVAIYREAGHPLPPVLVGEAA